jgi:formylglycine-generating enzyme required for sulfatase activity
VRDDLRASALLWMIVGSLVFVPACEPEPLPPFPEAVIVVHKDIATFAVGALRVDLFDDAKGWFDSATFELPADSDWPASFSVFSDDETREKTIWVRLRAHASGRTRDYRGERFRDWTDDEPALPSAAEPRLIRDGRDITPASEPEPLVAIDRLVQVTLRPRERREVSVELHGACAGTMARFGTDRNATLPVMGEASSCVGVERERVPVESIESSGASVASNDGCEAPGTDAVACIPGGVTVLGASDLFLAAGFPTTPERIVRVSRFWLDRHEVTVARWREAQARGFAVTSLPPYANEDVLSSVDDTRDLSYCTFSASPRGRESMPLTCVTWGAARQICRFFGGDLPTELQWEYAATTAGKPARTDYPWGNAAPDCARTVWGRAAQVPGVGGCFDLPRGPAPIDQEADGTPLGVLGLAGGVSEWTRDHVELYDSACWLRAPFTDPKCEEDASTTRTIRGGSWSSRALYLRSARRIPSEGDVRDPQIGFRCAYAVLPEGP